VMDTVTTGRGPEATPVRHEAPRPALPPDSPIEQLIRGAVNALQPATGIEALETALKQPEWSDDERARLHLALARLADSMQPPDAARAESSFTMAASLAQTTFTLAELARTRVELLMNRQEYAPAIALVQDTLADLPPAAPERISLQLFLGNLHELNQDAGAAESLYREVMENLRAHPVGDAGGYLRQTALQLSRLLRASGREQEADELAQSLSKELRLLEQQAAGAVAEEEHHGGTEAHEMDAHGAHEPASAAGEPHSTAPQGESKPTADSHGH